MTQTYKNTRADTFVATALMVYLDAHLRIVKKPLCAAFQ